MEPWTEIKTSIFTLKKIPHGDALYYRLQAVDWVNVIPLTDEGQLILVKQHRHGIDQETLELPGGEIDLEDASSLEAGKRELLEETGYKGENWELLGWVHPNPALFNNQCYTYLTTNVRQVADVANDPTEKTEVVIKPLSEIPSLIASKVITHSLVINAFIYLTMKYPKIMHW